MDAMASEKQDHWTTNAYTNVASFVPELANRVFEWLDPNPDDIILDIGCGDGLLSSKIKSKCHWVVGLDSSTNLIMAAQVKYSKTSNLLFEVRDCTRLNEPASKAYTQNFHKVFSNAALHWILRDSKTRSNVFESIHKALRPEGTFVFEMGGAGNVAEVHGALISAMVHHGMSVQAAREACPWYFPSEDMMRELLENAGFMVEKIEIEYRPTRLNEVEDGGLEGWVRLFGASMLESLEKQKRERVIREVVEALRSVVSREGGEGGQWLGYVRLRVLARKWT